MAMKRITALLCCGAFFFPAAASAYVGPGAGLSLLGALWALLIALGTAIVFVLAWPFRRMLRRKREARERQAKDQESASDRENATPARPATVPGSDEVSRQDATGNDVIGDDVTRPQQQ